MKFKELLATYDNQEIINKMIKLYYKDEELYPTGYIQVLDELRILDIEKSEYKITCKYVNDHDNFYYRISSYVEEETPTYGVSTIDWKIILDSFCEITDVSELDFLTHCLYELTWFGFSYVDVRKTIDSLFNEIGAIK